MEINGQLLGVGSVFKPWETQAWSSGCGGLAGKCLLTDLMCFVYAIYLTNKKVVLN